VSACSKLINLALHEALLKQWFDDTLKELKILYRGTENSFSKAGFNEKCLNKGPTLSVF
jgi:hypothetical protein